MSDAELTVDVQALRGRVALVAGATRGAGRGIAIGLGEAGATVICTGRSSRTGRGGSDYDRPETIEETAELVTAAGGTGIAVQVDHLDPTSWSTTSGVPRGSRVARRNQRSVTSAELAAHYGFTDLDGSRPDSWREPH